MTPPAHWIEITLDRAGSEVRVTLSAGSGMERPPPHMLGVTLDALDAFAKQVVHAALRGKPLDAAALEQAQRLHDALFRGEVRDVVTRGAPSGGSLLVRLMIRDGSLQAIPWEALCRPGTSALSEGIPI